MDIGANGPTDFQKGPVGWLMTIGIIETLKIDNLKVGFLYMLNG